MKKLIVIFVFFLFLQEARLQAQDSLRNRHLREVVITGQYEPQSARNSVYDVRVIPMEVIRSRGAVRLEDVLNTELNIRFSQDPAVGGSRLSMQGLSGQNIKILVDGVPLVGRQGALNEIDINQINVHSIERIEIVQGPMAVMYGSDALAGIINIITKKNDRNAWSFTAGLVEKSAGAEYGLSKGIHNQNLAGQYARGKWYAGIDLAKNYFGGWQGQKVGREKAWLPKDRIMAGARVGFKPESGNVYYRVDYLYQYIYNPGPIIGSQILDQEYTTNRFMHQLQGSYKFSDRLSFSGIGSYTDYSRRKQTVVIDTASGQTTLSLGEGSQSETNIDGVTTRGTFLYKSNKRISVQAGFDINLEYGQGLRIKTDNPGIADYALFGSVEWEPLEGVHIRPGFRVGYNSVYQTPPIIPALNTSWNINPRHTLRLSYGHGFRAPSLRELYFNFFDNSHSIQGNPDLKAETSHSVNGAWNWTVIEAPTAQWSTTLRGFYNTVGNRIDYGQKNANSTVLTYINISNYKTYGIAWRNKVKINQLDASVGLSYTHALFWSPEVTSNLLYKIPKAGLLLSLYYKYTGETLLYLVGDDQQGESPARRADYHMLDFTIQKTFLNHFTLTAGAQNMLGITNTNNILGASAATSIHGSGTSTPIAYGRSYFVGITYTLNHKLNHS